jgi:AGCS family alanine or glycine:cation symporter
MFQLLQMIENWVDMARHIIWEGPMLVLLIGIGIWLTICLKGLQFRKLGYSLWLALIKRKEKGDTKGEITHFQALMTALSATVGTGNIAGVATAIAVGGPGALFWMWMTGLFGMAIKYSEAILSVKYRVVAKRGQMIGGPMYYLSRGVGWKWLGMAFAIFTAIAAFGNGGMVQANSVADAVKANFHVPTFVTGLSLMLLTAWVILKGIKRIGKVVETLVPFMILLYVIAAVFILVTHVTAIPSALSLVFKLAFAPTAAAGGFLGASVMMTVQMGLARGVFSNESGLGSAGIAAAAAQTKHPTIQALVSMTQTFIDTIVVCSLTGLVLIVTHTWTTGKTAAELTSFAFQISMKGGGFIVSFCLLLFAYSSILGWSYYGEKAAEYLFGERIIKLYRWIFIVLVGVGAIAKLQFVWAFCDLFNGLMAIPNLIGLFLLSPIIVEETRLYFLNHHKSN